MLIIRKTRDLDGATLCQLIARAQNRDMARMEKHPEMKAPMTRGNKAALWGLCAVGLWFVVNVIVAAVK